MICTQFDNLNLDVVNAQYITPLAEMDFFKDDVILASRNEGTIDPPDW